MSKKRFTQPPYYDDGPAPASGEDLSAVLPRLEHFRMPIWDKSVHPPFTAGGHRANMMAGGSTLPGSQIQLFDLPAEAQHVAFLYEQHLADVNAELDSVKYKLANIERVLHPVPETPAGPECPHCNEELEWKGDSFVCWDCESVFNKDLEEI
jgi:hypothetical protein